MSARASVASVSLSPSHSFSKPCADSIRLLQGLGVEGDAHCGKLVQHLSRSKTDPNKPNLRQVHLLSSAVLAQFASKGIQVRPGEMGENITTQGMTLMRLPSNSLLHIGATAIVRLTGLRTPCKQIDEFRPGLFQEVIKKRPDGTYVLNTGVMGVVIAGGEVRPGDKVRIERPPKPWSAMDLI